MKKKVGRLRNGGSKGGAEGQQGRAEVEEHQVCVGWRGGIVGSGGGAAMFYPVMPVRAPWKVCFPFVRRSCVECKWPLLLPAWTLNG